MSRFDDELIRTADNAWQQSGAPSPTDAVNYDQVTNMYLEGPFGLSGMSPAPVDEVANWTSNQPARHIVQVTDLDASGLDVQSQPGFSGVYASLEEGIDETLYQVYKASREIREAIESGLDFSFGQLFTAANNAIKFTRQASEERWLTKSVGTIAGLAQNIEDELVNTANYHQAASSLREFETYLEDIKKYASDDDSDDNDDSTTTDVDGKTSEASRRVAEREERLSSMKNATNGNQETLQHDDVRALDNVAPYMNVGPDATTNVLLPQEVNGQDAGYVPYYNDGSETGITPGQLPHGQEVFPMDQTNPAFVPYAGTVASREKIFEALQVVERLEKLGMVNNSDRMKHVAKFEQMSDAKLAGFVASLDMLEESGARQPRSQKVASGNNRMPEMGRLTTASTTNRESILADDWLMTL